MDVKFSTNYPVMVLWLLCRLTHVLVYLLLDMNVTLDGVLPEDEPEVTVSPLSNTTAPPDEIDPTFC